jgi:hypothetical protein
MKYTKKQIAEEYDCMASVKGPYAEGDQKIKNAIIKAEEPYVAEYVIKDTGERKTGQFVATSRQDIIDRAYDILTTTK